MKHLSQKGKFICRMDLKWKRDGWVGRHAEHSDSVTETCRGSWDVFMLYVFTSVTWLKAVSVCKEEKAEQTEQLTSCLS